MTKICTVIEFYSGLGGTHLALESSSVPFEVRAAFEINPTANLIYTYNFPNVPLMQRNILSLSPAELDSLKADMWTMSPPCQPFTRQGKQMDLEDSRTDSFMHLIDTLQKMQHPPKYMFVENVKGFEISNAHNRLTSVLLQMNYSFKEFLLSPNQFGIPNSRLRFYLLAKRSPLDAVFDLTSELEINEASDAINLRPVADFLERSIENFDEYLLNDNVLGKYSEVLDVVTSESYHSCCFTKGYLFSTIAFMMTFLFLSDLLVQFLFTVLYALLYFGYTHYIEGTGSVLQSNQNENLDDVYAMARSIESKDQKAETLKCLKLRWFTPKEVANLMGFPSSFEFPAGVTTKQKYRLLGNSVNVCVISHLLKLLLKEDV